MTCHTAGPDPRWPVPHRLPPWNGHADRHSTQAV